MSHRRTRTFVLALAVTVLAATPARADVPSGPYPVQTNFPLALAQHAFTPDQAPPGANRWSCRPSAAHPEPVVLVNGTFDNQSFNWTAMAPALANAGYCVYTFNYGRVWWTSSFRSLGDIPTSARELGRFVDHVLGATGAKEVDLVGYSQGGMMPNWYLKELGGAPKVDQLIGLAPSNHGTTISGTNVLLGAFPVTTLLAWMTPALNQQLVGSDFLRRLHATPDTVAGVRYSVIATEHDIAVTPWRSQFLQGPDVRNLTVQDTCPSDPVGHLGMPYDPTVIQLTLNELDRANPTPVVCSSGFPL